MSYNTKILEWKDKNFKYSHIINLFNYRNDCSGFLSYVWGLNNDMADGGPRTFNYQKLKENNLISYSTQILKDDLKFGDAILFPKKHVVIFDKWEDSTKNKYFCYEMCNHRNKLTKKIISNFNYRLIDYPYNKYEIKFSNFLLIRNK